MMGRLQLQPWVVVLLALYVAALVVLLAVLHEQRVRECHTAADLRNDHRSMWVALLDANPDAPQHDAVAELLDQHLPRLGCHGSKLVESP